ncbi:hypothetical protein G7051_05330 [Dysgonomonas sp. HDW5B]|uniref:hypothetical protein n=1 Tax=Dysgonomonas sp. HDW5B TaxID=2714927 RepID=UPI001409980F|nr:hypothetical protein [Dysgonomonas sp. HDW5B]QIK53792.1 hypothetical protein G7051_05330 [Dysgonomonas sp. HDW5B]
MRFVIKKDEDKTAKLASNETLQVLEKIVKTKNRGLITEAIYRDSYDTEDGRCSYVEDKLAIAYKNKCAYCERICKADIEHYRPKKGVTEDDTHLGYYWLCYEWTNLIPSCITCNREGAKHNKFPILGKRVINPPLLPDGSLNLTLCKAGTSPLRDETPCLLHPEVDDPVDYFVFELDAEGKGIRIKGIDMQGRGAETISICRLNRNELKLDRVKSVIDDFKESIHSLFVLLERDEIDTLKLKKDVIQQLRLLKNHSLNDEKTYTLLRKYIVASSTNFERIVIPFLDSKIRRIVLEAFKSIEPLQPII